MFVGNSVSLAHMLITEYARAGIRNAVDATLGRGRDALFLSGIVQEKVYGFDVQAEAINISRKLFEREEVRNVELIHDSHSNLDKYVSTREVDLVLFNLGYLPRGGDMSITTMPDTTIVAIEKSLRILCSGGLVMIVVYHGHEQGRLEAIELDKYLSTIDQKMANVLKMQFINQINNPPYVIMIEKK